MKEHDFIAVYIFKYPFEYEKKDICKERLDYMNSKQINKTEKEYGWALLDIAVEEKLHKNLNDLNPRRIATGKWVIDDYYISISESGKFCMVGLSNKPIGVDIQKLREGFDVNDRLSEDEKEYYGKVKTFDNFIIHTQKEAIYKCFEVGENDWKERDTTKYIDNLVTFEFNYREYYCSVCSPIISLFDIRKVISNGEVKQKNAVSLFHKE